MTSTELIDLLAQHRTLGAAPRAELEWLMSHGTVRTLEPGTILSAKGVAVEGMFVILSGHVAIYVDRGAGVKKVLEWKAGDVAGVLPYSRLTTPPGDSVAQEPTVLLDIPREQLREMTVACHEVTSALVKTMLDRARVFTSSDLHDEKLVSLGMLSARLAHELNNPVAAIERSAALLEELLDEEERAAMALGAERLDEKQLVAIAAVRSACLAQRAHGVLSPIQQAQREDAITDWLEDHGLSGEVAAALADTAVTIEALDQIATVVDGKCLDAVLRWAAAGCSVRALASEIQDAATRIAGLVTSIKGFTHMDQGIEAIPVDLALGLGNTVNLFRSKAREKSASITLDVEPGLPHVTGFPGELNQIFSNLIDNALDAVPAHGHVAINVGRDVQGVIVRVVNDGPEIPPEVRERMFELFFTTKPVGKGTGVGLDIVRRLLPHNNGRVEVESVPGRTEFKVWLQSTDAEPQGAKS